MFKDYVEQNTNKTQLAKELGISRVRLYDWKVIGVPFEKIAEVSRITGISVTALVLETYANRYGSEGLNSKR